MAIERTNAQLIQEVMHRLPSTICWNYADSKMIILAVLNAIYEPSGGMIDEGAESFGVGNTIIGDLAKALNGQPTKCWKAMIDALKKELEG